jgi:hypothetical protein
VDVRRLPVAGSDGYVQCGECWRTKARDFARLETVKIETLGNDPQAASLSPSAPR